MDWDAVVDFWFENVRHLADHKPLLGLMDRQARYWGFDAIKHAWHAHRGPIAIPRQALSDAELLASSRRLGELNLPPHQAHGRQSPDGYPEI